MNGTGRDHVLSGIGHDYVVGRASYASVSFAADEQILTHTSLAKTCALDMCFHSWDGTFSAGGGTPLYTDCIALPPDFYRRAHTPRASNTHPLHHQHDHTSEATIRDEL